MDSSDYKQFLEAVAKSVDRTRISIYLLTVAVIALAGFIWSFDAAPWPKLRENWTRQYLNQCKDDDPNPTATCKPLNQIVKIQGWDSKFLQTYHDKQVEILTKNERITVPILNLEFDRNDIGVISGVSFNLLFVVILGNLRRQKLCTEYCLDAASDSPDRHRFLLLASVLFIPHPSSETQKEWWFMGLLFVTISLYGYAIFLDCYTYCGLALLPGFRKPMWYGFPIEFISFVIMVIAAKLCWKAMANISSLIARSQKEICKTLSVTINPVTVAVPTAGLAVKAPEAE